VAGNAFSRYSVCGYDTTSLARLWIYEAASSVGAVCMLGAHVLVTVAYKPTLVLDCMTGAHVRALLKANGYIYGLGVVEGLFSFISLLDLILRPQHLCVPSHAPTSPLQASQAFASAAGNVGLDRKVSHVVVIGLL
jgi:hypothetical protein